MEYYTNFTNREYFLSKEECRKIYHRKREYFKYFGVLNLSVSALSEEIGTCYLWTFEMNDKIVYGRSISELADFFERFRQIILKSRRSSYTMNFILYLQKAQDLFYFIYRNDKFDFDKNEVIYFNRSNEVFKFYFNKCFEVRSLEMLTEYELETYSDILENDFKIDYFIENRIYGSKSFLSMVILNYYEKKTKVLHDFIKNFYFADYVDRKGTSVANIPVTSTGDVKRILRKAHGKKAEYEINRDFQFFCCGYNSSYKKDSIFDGISKTGFTRYNDNFSNIDLENIESWDYDSFYPYLLLTKKFPCEIQEEPFLEDAFFQKRYYDQIMKNEAAFFIEVTFKKIKAVNMNLSFLSGKSKNYLYGKNVKKDAQGSLKSADVITYRMTGIDLQNVMKFYEVEEMRFNKVYSAHYAFLPLWYRRAVVALYVEKEKLKKYRHRSKVDEEKYKQAKRRLNRLYGVLIESPDRFYKFIDSNGNIKNSDALTNENDKSHYAYQWGIYVTAYARDIILRWASFLKGNFIYCDVDCIKFKYDKIALDLIERVNAETKKYIKKLTYYYHFNFEGFEDIGQLKNEGRSELFKVLGVKRYAELKNGKFKCTVSGLTDEDKARYFSDCKREIEKYQKFQNNSVFECFSNNCIANRNLKPFTVKFTDHNGAEQVAEEKGSIIYLNRDFSFDFSSSKIGIKSVYKTDKIQKYKETIERKPAGADKNQKPAERI